MTIEKDMILNIDKDKFIDNKAVFKINVKTFNLILNNMV